MDYKEMPLAELLQNRSIFEVFDDEFQKGTWLDITALLRSESSINDLKKDGTIPTDVVEKITTRIDDMIA